MNVTEEALHEYIGLFHHTLELTAEQFLDEDLRRSLTHTSLLPARIVGYVSTQFGTAIEYLPAAKTEIEIQRGSARIEDLIVRAPPFARKIGPMFSVQEGQPGFYSTGGVYGATLEGAFPFRLMGTHAGFRLGDVRFKFGPWQRDVHFAEIFGTRAFSFWSKEAAVARAKDEVLAALAQTKRAAERNLPLAEYTAKFKERTVLLLGDYSAEGMERLHELAAAVASLGYDPILVKDIPDIQQQDLAQKVAMIGGLARFVIVDDTSKSGHLVEVQLCRTYSWITILLRAGGNGASWMTAGAEFTSNVILELPYDCSVPVVAIEKCANWAEAKIVELGRKYDSIFPWRTQA